MSSTQASLPPSYTRDPCAAGVCPPHCEGQFLGDQQARGPSPSTPGAVPVQEAEGAVVNSEPHDAHVVRVEHAMAEADTLPLGHHPCCSPGHLGDRLWLLPPCGALTHTRAPSASPGCQWTSLSGSQSRALCSPLPLGVSEVCLR